MEGKIDKNELAYFGFPVWEFASKEKRLCHYLLEAL
jgi:hypothetical protein